MLSSARNALACRVKTIHRAPVNVEIVMETPAGVEIVAVVTNDSVEALRLEPGRDVIALIKSSFIILAKGEGDTRPTVSARNVVAGTIVSRIDGEVNSEIKLDVGAGQFLISTVTTESADELPLNAGGFAFAFFKASQVILAVE